VVSQKGNCPYCLNLVMPTCTEENILQRDVFKCPVCKARIVPCRMPGCQDYAKGGEIWDDEFCPKCFNDLPKTAGAAVALTVTVGEVLAKLKK